VKRALISALVSLLVAAAPAGAAAPGVGPLVPVSVPDLFPEGCGGMRVWPGGDFEPHAVADPADPSAMAVAWIEGTGVTIVVASTRDGGRTWSQARVPGLHCTGDEASAATGDPWLAYGPDGMLYLTAGSVTGARDPAGTSRRAKVIASRSLDGGRTWSSATVVEDDTDFNDKMAITADPAQPGHAWIVWTKGRQGPDYVAGDVRITETRDGGRTWSPGRVIVETNPDPQRYPWGATLRVLPGGELLVATMVWQPAGISELPLPERGNFNAVAVRSTDGGATWSVPVNIADVPAATVTDPEDGKKVRANQGVSLEVAPDGTAYTAWWEKAPDGPARVMLARSDDGGATWSQAAVVGSPRQAAFLPALAVHDNGTVGVTYYALENDVPGDSALPTRLWFAHSHDRGATWDDAQVVGPFDYRSAQEISGGFFLGDYFGLVPTPRGFLSVPALAAPLAREGPSDVFAARVTVLRSPPRLRLSVRPRSARIGRRTRFVFAVTDRYRRPRARTLVRFARRSTRTDRRGRAVIVRTLRHPGRRRAAAAKDGYARAKATLRALPRRRGR